MAHHHRVEPAGPTTTLRVDAVLVAPVDDGVAQLVEQLGGERTGSDARDVGLGDADDPVDVHGSDAGPRARAAGDGVRRRDVGIGAVVEIEEGRLRTLEHDVLARIERLAGRLRDRFELAAITNDIYTKEDARILAEAGALPIERIMGVETGGCPHTAIREDASINLAAIGEMNKRFPDLDLILVESGGDNLAATFSPELADLTIYVIDVAAGEKIPRKGGPGITRSDLLVINKIDLAPMVGANLEVMDRDARRMRGTRPFLFSNLKENKGVDEVASFIVRQGGLPAR